MKRLLTNISIEVNDKLYVKKPDSSDLGKKIIEHSILLIDEIGFEAFTFKKLGEKIGSNESSIYRYFENKHKLMLYLSSWYWSWKEYQLVFATHSIQDPAKKLEEAIKIVTQETLEDASTSYVNEAVLFKIIISEFTKTLLTKEVDTENKEGFFKVYKSVISRIIEMIENVNPNYPFAKSLASSIVEGALHQHFLKNHFGTITNFSNNNSSEFYLNMINKIVI
jgi:AcrR family transcriptional regulator